jgi:hypothetical protein
VLLINGGQLSFQTRFGQRAGLVTATDQRVRSLPNGRIEHPAKLPSQVRKRRAQPWRHEVDE